MKNRKFVFLVLALILIISCNLPTAAPVINSLETATPTPTPESAGITPTATITSSSTVPLAAPNNVPLNCRSGPGTAWPVVIILSPGQSTEIVGRNADSSWLYVKNINSAGSFCWIAAEFATVTGDVSPLALVPAPALPPTSNVPTSTPASQVVVTSILVSITPDTIHVGGCIGPIQPIKVSASITTNGAIDFTWHFQDDQTGDRPKHDITFTKAGTQNVSDSFTPPLNAGSFGVQMRIDGMKLKGMNAIAFYKITC